MTYLKSIIIKLSPVFLTLFLAACGGANDSSSSDTQASKKGNGSGIENSNKQISTDLGNIIGNPVTKQGYSDFNGGRKLSINVTITPYEKGFKVLYKPIDKYEICGLSYVMQDGKKLTWGTISNTSDSFQKIIVYDGYVVYGQKGSCGDYKENTEWAIFAERVGFDKNQINIGFNPRKPYSVGLGSDIKDEQGKKQVFEINPQ